MDGVIVRSEQLWETREPAYLRQILDPSIAQQIIGKTKGMSVSLTYDWAAKLGYNGTKKDFSSGYFEIAKTIYNQAPITPGMDDLIGELSGLGFRLGLVSSSSMEWIMTVVARLQNGSKFTYIESVNDHPNLKPKPSPDGYLEAMKVLKSTPQETLIIEDSQTGVNAAIASGAHVCCFTVHSDGNFPHGVDSYAHTIVDLKKSCLDFLKTTLTHSQGR